MCGEKLRCRPTRKLLVEAEEKTRADLDHWLNQVGGGKTRGYYRGIQEGGRSACPYK